jgi:hypothetical protein
MIIKILAEILRDLFQKECFPKNTASHIKAGKMIALYLIRNNCERITSCKAIINHDDLYIIHKRSVNHTTVRLLKKGSEVI